jgi:head-tail adaptor
MPGAGDLRERITFQRRGDDINGDPLGAWIDDFTISAQIIYLRGMAANVEGLEPVMQQRLQGVVPVVLVVRTERRTRALDSTWRAVDARNTKRIMNITSVTPNKDRGFVDILARIGGTNG